MRIISKFKDYYDGATGGLIDPNLTYVRHTEKVFGGDTGKQEQQGLIGHTKRGYYHKAPSKFTHEVGLFGDWGGLYYPTRGYNLHYKIIGFCGKTYPIFEIVRHINDGSINGTHEVSYIYDADEQIKFLEDRWADSWYRKKNMKDYLDFNHTWHCDSKSYNDKRSMDLSIDLNTPIWIYHSFLQGEYNVLEKNPKLKDYNFYTVKDTFTAMQEISMFMGGVLGGGEPDMIEISEKDKISSKGFDTKYGFRKRPKDKK